MASGCPETGYKEPVPSGVQEADPRSSHVLFHKKAPGHLRPSRKSPRHPGHPRQEVYLFYCQVFRSEENTSELQSLMRISYAVFCLKKKMNNKLNKEAHATHY